MASRYDDELWALVPDGRIPPPELSAWLAARRNGAHLPVTALVDQFYSEVQSMGGKRWDTSSLIALLERK